MDKCVQLYKNDTLPAGAMSRVECGELAIRPPGMNQICKINRHHTTAASS
jgi:hypothetical protein